MYLMLPLLGLRQRGAGFAQGSDGGITVVDGLSAGRDHCSGFIARCIAQLHLRHAEKMFAVPRSRHTFIMSRFQIAQLELQSVDRLLRGRPLLLPALLLCLTQREPLACSVTLMNLRTAPVHTLSQRVCRTFAASSIALCSFAEVTRSCRSWTIVCSSWLLVASIASYLCTSRSDAALKASLAFSKPSSRSRREASSICASARCERRQCLASCGIRV